MPIESLSPQPPANPNSAKLVFLLAGAAIVFVVLLAGASFYFGQRRLGQQKAGAAVTGGANRSDIGKRTPALSKEEVGAIIGVPVTSVEMEGSDAHYRTATTGMEASIEVEHQNDEADAVQSMAGARTVTKNAFGGKAAPVLALGDEAIYGAFNVLYVRKSDVILTITPPNLKQVAQMQQYNDMTSQPMGSDAQAKSLQKLADLQKGDSTAASLSKPDAASGAVDLIHHAATEQHDEYETKARTMAREMAEKVLAKL